MVKTDFKNIYEAFMHCDTNKLKKEFAAMYSDNEEQAAAMEEQEFQEELKKAVNKAYGNGLYAGRHSIDFG